MLTADKRDVLLSLTTPLVVDTLNRLGLPERVVDPRIRPFVPFLKMAGTAVTVRVVSQPDPAKANLDRYYEAFESGRSRAFPILVVEVSPDRHRGGIFGGGAATVCRYNGFVGALIEGSARDTHELKEMNFPVFTRFTTPGYLVGKVEAVGMNEPVEIGGQTVAPGQIIFGDNDGVVIFDPEHLDAVLEKAAAIRDWEHKVHRLLAQGAGKDAISQVGPMP